MLPKRSFSLLIVVVVAVMTAVVRMIAAAVVMTAAVETVAVINKILIKYNALTILNLDVWGHY